MTLNFQCIAPKVFEIAFALLKPFLHERTKNKISIYSHEPNVWKTALLAEINPEELPVAYGGTMTDPDGDPNCKAMVCPNITFDPRQIYLLVFCTGQYGRRSTKILLPQRKKSYCQREDFDGQ